MTPKVMINLAGAAIAALAVLFFTGVLDTSGAPETPVVSQETIQQEVFNIDGQQRATINAGKDELARRKAAIASSRADADAKVQSSYDSVMAAHAAGNSMPRPNYSGRDNSRVVDRVESKLH